MVRHARLPVSTFAYLFERFPSFVQTFVYREAVEMVRQGMAPLLISIRRPDDPPELMERLDAEVIYLPEEKALRKEVDARRADGKLPGKVHRVIPRRRSEADSQRIFEAAWLGPFLKERGVRHVHAHFGGMAARTAWWLRELHGIGYSFTGHANDIFCETDFPVSNADLVRDAVFVVTETDHARRWMESKHPFAKGKVHRVFNGIATSGFPERAPVGGAPVILSVGRSVEKKGFPVLIDACDLLRKRGVAFECHIVGGGPLDQSLAAQIGSLGLGESVKLLGPRSQDEIRAMLVQCAVFALASIPEKDGGSDNLPTVVMEAMACGAPVVSTELAGIPEMIANGENGLLVTPGSAAELAGAIESLLNDRTLADQLGAAGRKTAEARFAIGSTTTELKRLIVKLARVAPPPSAIALDPALAEVQDGRAFWRRFF